MHLQRGRAVVQSLFTNRKKPLNVPVVGLKKIISSKYVLVEFVDGQVSGFKGDLVCIEGDVDVAVGAVAVGGVVEEESTDVIRERVMTADDDWVGEGDGRDVVMCRG